MRVIRLVFASLFIFLNVFPFQAREVDKKKLKDFINMDLEFVNYRGPYDSTDTYQQIVGIGEFLAKNLINNKSNYYKRYYLNRYVDNSDDKSSTDVFLIGASSSLDSILNLRRILTGYLIEAFGYSRESAALLAKAITISNAVYRGDLNYYSDAYIQPALEGISKENVGLSRVYSQWAGKTCIFIPLKRDILSGSIETDVDLDKLVTDKVLGALLNENEEVQTDFARELTDVQDEMRDVDQDKVDIESDALKSISDELNKTIDNLREQLERATDDFEKERIKKQIDDKVVGRDVLKNKESGLEKSQKKLDNSQSKLDKQRDAVKNKLQEKIDQANKDKNLPKPGDISSPKVDEKLQLTEAIEDLKEQLERATDDVEKERIKKQIDDKVVRRDVLKNKESGLEKSQKKLDNSQSKLDKQRDVAKNKLQEKIGQENKDKNLPKPGDISSLKVDEKLQLTEAIEDLKKQLEKATDDVEKERIKKQIDDKVVGRDVLKNKENVLEKSQKKLDNSQSKLDKQRDVAKNKLQEKIDQENKDKNLPKPGDISSLKVDEKLQLTEAIEDLKEQLEKATDDVEKERIKKQIDDKVVRRDVLKNKESGLEKSQKKLDNSQSKLDKQRDVAKNKLQEKIGQENKDKNLPKPGDISSLKVDEKLQLTEAIEDLKKQLEKATDDVEKERIKKQIDDNMVKRENLGNRPLNSKMQLAQSVHPKNISKLPLNNANHKHKSVFLEIINPNTNLGVLRLIDADENKVKEASQYGIRRYGIYERDNDFVAIRLCSGVAKLQLISKSENLEVKSQAKFDLNRNSSLFVDSKMILVVVKDNNMWKLAKFAPNDLNKFVLSEDEIFPFTSFTVDEKYVYLQDASKNIITLDLNTLKKIFESKDT
ncbi:P83/100 family protein [Borrelia sp. HM]|uniref:P83/100 family protein n=1 Tax=Borrelia sp. HM TaxID=1882662 RepID=UPI001C760B73|nr:P83/100 family protein [Borrelia sp. HM]BCR22153.1 hypothetical protein BKFM_00745 [Borrelia sp. HM]